MTKFDKIKYENVILYLAKELGGRIMGKKKLAKLLYFADFDFYEKYEQPMTGDLYKHLPMGPFPTNMETVVTKMEEEGKIVIEQQELPTGFNPLDIYTAKVDPDLSVLSNEERAMLDRVIKIYGELSGTQLENLTHDEAPYIGSKPSQEIPYELSLYRGTDFSTLTNGA